MAVPDAQQTAAVARQLLGPTAALSEQQGTPDELLSRLALDPDLTRQLLLDLEILQRDYERQGLRQIDFQLALASMLSVEATLLFWGAREVGDPEQADPKHTAEHAAVARTAGELLESCAPEDACLSTRILIAATMTFSAIASLCSLVHRVRAHERENGDGS